MYVLKQRDGLLIVRNEDRVIYTATSDSTKAELANAVRFLIALRGTIFVPNFISYKNDVLVAEYIEDRPVTDERLFKNNCKWLLETLTKHEVVHGDLTRPNIRIRKNVPIVIDWNEARFESESRPDKRPEGDEYHLNLVMQSVVN